MAHRGRTAVRSVKHTEGERSTHTTALGRPHGSKEITIMCFYEIYTLCPAKIEKLALRLTKLICPGIVIIGLIKPNFQQCLYPEVCGHLLILPLLKNTLLNNRVRRLQGRIGAKDGRLTVLEQMISFHSWKGGGLNSLEVDINITKYTEGKRLLVRKERHA